MLTASSFHSWHHLLHQAAGEEGGGDEARGEQLGGGEDAAHEEHVGQRAAQAGGELRHCGAGPALRDLTQSGENILFCIEDKMILYLE